MSHHGTLFYDVMCIFLLNNKNTCTNYTCVHCVTCIHSYILLDSYVINTFKSVQVNYWLVISLHTYLNLKIQQNIFVVHILLVFTNNILEIPTQGKVRKSRSWALGYTEKELKPCKFCYASYHCMDMFMNDVILVTCVACISEVYNIRNLCIVVSYITCLYSWLMFQMPPGFKGWKIELHAIIHCNYYHCSRLALSWTTLSW